MNKQLVIGFVAGVGVASVASVGMLSAQPAANPQPQPTAMVPGPVAQVPGSVQVTRLTDTSFVVVKDQGDTQVVTLFSTEAGIIQKKHAGRFMY